MTLSKAFRLKKLTGANEKENGRLRTSSSRELSKALLAGANGGRRECSRSWRPSDAPESFTYGSVEPNNSLLLLSFPIRAIAL